MSFMDSYRDEDEFLAGALSWQKRNKPSSKKLSVCGKEYFGKNLRRLEKNARIVDAWEELLPAGLKEHCRLKNIEGGVVELQVDAGSYMHEMRLMKNELLEHLRQKCGQTAVKRIKLSNC